MRAASSDEVNDNVHSSTLIQLSRLKKSIPNGEALMDFRMAESAGRTVMCIHIGFEALSISGCMEATGATPVTIKGPVRVFELSSSNSTFIFRSYHASWALAEVSSLIRACWCSDPVLIFVQGKVPVGSIASRFTWTSFSANFVQDITVGPLNGGFGSTDPLCNNCRSWQLAIKFMMLNNKHFKFDFISTGIHFPDDVYLFKKLENSQDTTEARVENRTVLEII